MPIYEYRCNNCNKNSSLFVRSISSNVDTTCPSCGSNHMERTMSRFGIGRSLQSIHENSGVATMSPGPDYYSDPRNIGRVAESKFSEMGMEMPSDVRDMIDAARDGVMPDSVKDLQPNIGEL